MFRTIIVVAAAFSMALSAASAARLTPPAIAPSGTWHELHSPRNIWPTAGALYYSFSLPGGSRAHLVVIDMKTGKWHVRPALAGAAICPTSTLANQELASAAINGGYFNLRGDAGASASYVTINGSCAADPRTNKTLMENPKLQSYLPQILNRSEVRFLEDGKGKRCAQIARHNDPLPANLKLIHSLQAGPRLLPTLTAEDEAFVRLNPDGSPFDSIGVHKDAARTAFGITSDGYAMLITVAGKGQDPESSGITLEELAALLKKLGCSEAINLDGGASSTMYVRLSATGTSTADNPTPPGTVVCGKNPETNVKSILMIEPAASGAGRRRR